MQIIVRGLSILPILALAACATAPTVSNISTTAPGPLVDTATLAPAQTSATAAAPAMDVSAYVDPVALKLLSANSKTQAAGAQFNALQFGRVGAPRNWVGDNGQSGQVTVGPYVRVNLIDCRDFTHTITIAGQAYVKKGTACREADGTWTVSPSVG